jgi:hypothetical protein
MRLRLWIAFIFAAGLALTLSTWLSLAQAAPSEGMGGIARLLLPSRRGTSN